MTKAHKISSIIIAIVMLIACIIGVATRLSYKVFDPNVAIYELENINVNIEAIERIELESVLNDLEAAESVFVVYVKKSERCYQTTKVTTKVNKVIKGNPNEVDKKIVIYEPNFLDYSKSNKRLYYFPINHINNMMIENKEYLIFCNKIDYADSYQKTLKCNEYVVEWDWHLYSFPIEYEADYIVNRENLTYKDIKKFDYICFDLKDANKIDTIRKSILDEYL